MSRLAFFLVSACSAIMSVTACAEAETRVDAEGAPSDVASQNVFEAPSASEAIVDAAPDDAWRAIAPDNLIYMRTSKGDVWIELAPEFAPLHVDRFRDIARNDWMDWKVFHRVIDGFMAQAGGAIDNPSIRSPFPNVPAEFTIRRNPNEIVVTELQDRQITPRVSERAQAGFWNGFPAGTQPAALAGIVADGTVESWLLHCDGAASMARTNDPNSGNAQFYVVRGDAEHLNTTYTVWGKVRIGQEVIESLNEGTMGQSLGFRPDVIEEFQLASDMEPSSVPVIEVMDTRSTSFTDYLQAVASSTASGRLPDICEVDVPVRVRS